MCLNNTQSYIVEIYTVNPYSMFSIIIKSSSAYQYHRIILDVVSVWCVEWGQKGVVLWVQMTQVFFKCLFLLMNIVQCSNMTTNIVIKLKATHTLIVHSYHPTLWKQQHLGLLFIAIECESINHLMLELILTSRSHSLLFDINIHNEVSLEQRRKMANWC